MTLKHINITEINLKLNMQDKNVGFYLDFSIEYVNLRYSNNGSGKALTG